MYASLNYLQGIGSELEVLKYMHTFLKDGFFLSKIAADGPNLPLLA